MYCFHTSNYDNWEDLEEIGSEFNEGTK
jgi:hypothetical protein